MQVDDFEFANSDNVILYIQSIVQCTLQQQITLSPNEISEFITDESKRGLYICKQEDALVATFQPIDTIFLAFIKRVSQLSQTVSLPDQVLLMNYPQDNGSKIIFDYLHYALSPFFESSLKEEQDKAGYQLTRKKLKELELSLIHLQQNVAIPTVTLKAHPKIMEMIAQGNRDPSELVQDSTFLNKIQNDVNSWIKEIQKVTLLSRDIVSGTTRQEIEFWNMMERSLQQIEGQLKAEHVQLTLDILKAAKRFHATVSFIADTGIKEATDKVTKYNQLMKDFPINELLAAVDLEKIKESVDLIFGHFNKKLKLSPYPVSRALLLAEAISKDLNTQILGVLQTRKLMYVPYNEFLLTMRKCRSIFESWDENIKEFISVCRDVTRKRSEKFIPVKINAFHTLLQERLKFVELFRTQHEQLLSTISKVIRDGDENEDIGLTDKGAVEDINSAFEVIKAIDVLDVTPEGVESWSQAETLYNDRIALIEHQIISRLRDTLATAHNAGDMFRVFSKFNSLFIRPKIRGAIHEYQAQLIERVKEDIKKLFDKFMTKHSNSESLALTKVRDIPSVSASIMWASTVERRLAVYMKKVEAVLGEGWEKYADGQKLLQEEQAFRKQLDTLTIFNRWVQEETNREFVRGRIFLLNRNRLRGNQYELSINFDAKSISVFKEVRNLIWLGYNVPIHIQNMAKDSKRVYPFAVSLNETLRIYLKTLNRIEENESIRLLTAGIHVRIQNLISKGVQLRWDFFVDSYELQKGNENRHVVFVREIASTVSDFQEKASLAAKYCDEIEMLIKELSRSRYDKALFELTIGKIQKNVDLLNYESFDNVIPWSREIDRRVEDILLVRLTEACKEWNEGNVLEQIHRSSDRDDAFPVVHQLKIRNQTLYLDPPLESVRSNLTRYLQQWLANVTSLPRVRVFQFESSQSKQKVATYAITSRLDPKLLSHCYQKIDDYISAADGYVSKWLQYQALWDLNPANVFETLGDDLDNWCNVIVQVRKSRSIFDTSKTLKSFDFMTVDYGNVQAKVNAQYDQWQRELVSKFSLKLCKKFTEFFEAVQTTRTKLEKTNFGSSTEESVKAVLFVQDCVVSAGEWECNLDAFRAGQKILERQRFSFPSDWMYFDQISGEWGAFDEILKRKKAVLNDKIPSIKDQIIKENQNLVQFIADLCMDWDLHKPIKGNTSPTEAKSILFSFQNKFGKLRTTYDMFLDAKKVLSLEMRTGDQIVSAMGELDDIQSVWDHLTGVWDELENLKLILWNSEQSWQLKSMLDQLVMKLKDMPNRVRQYASFQSLQNRVAQTIQKHTKLLGLRSESLRERHWSRIFVIVNIDIPLSVLKVGDVWDNQQFEVNYKQIEEVIATSQGEMALEEFLKQVKSVWNNYAFEFSNFQNKCRLIKGWDDLFSKSQDHLGALAAMKNSVYFKAFKEEALTLEDQLSRLFYLLDKWILVQKQWVYLQGIFNDNPAIKHILPMESNRFSSIDSEFLGLLRRVYKSPLVFDVLGIPNIFQTINRLGDLLNGVQKSLGEYLERERSNFARYYFLSDEDLLEILGNTKDISRIQPHLKKMFAAVDGIILSDNLSEVVGISSKEGEIVSFKTSVSYDNTAPFFELLQNISNEVENTLYALLKESFDDLDGDYLGQKITANQVLKWVSKFPSQILVLSAQCKWTLAVENSIIKNTLKTTLDFISNGLEVVAQVVVQDLDPLLRAKCEGLITELVHQRDITRNLIEANVNSPESFQWLTTMRFYADEDEVVVRIANTSFRYGFEYLGIPDRLVRTPLTDRCYLTLCQALHNRLGGSPFGPAGTGKTESVKALANQLGRLCMVFCCDENFDFQSMGRIFVGLAKFGAWGCFDEFNRLEEKILSAVSQQIQSIQTGLRTKNEIELINQHLRVHPHTGIFITMNPGYAGRSELPDNLSSLFRGVAMTVPDKLLIAQVMLFSQGFKSAEKLASKVIPFFDICASQLSGQQHYDFGLRALKSVLSAAGRLQRRFLKSQSNHSTEAQEEHILVQSIRETVFPKLVEEDVAIAQMTLKDLFTKFTESQYESDEVHNVLLTVCADKLLVPSSDWVEKVLQLFNILDINHGVMIVGKSGTGKTLARMALFKVLEKLDKRNGFVHVINPKAITKDVLYGWLDSTTREWTDGIFTKILRDIIDDVRGDGKKRHWIVFDGDVDPEWVENLNSVLDDNKVLTLPNGERLPFPPNVRILFEVQNLDHATPATVSRCGMVFFPDCLISVDMASERYLEILSKVPVDEIPAGLDIDLNRYSFSEVNPLQRTAVESLRSLMKPKDVLDSCLKFAAGLDQIMECSPIQISQNLFSLLTNTIKHCLNYASSLVDGEYQIAELERYLNLTFYVHIAWSFGGNMTATSRKKFSGFLRQVAALSWDLDSSIFDFDVSFPQNALVPWKTMVPVMNLDPQSLKRHDVVIPTMDTLRHEKVIYSWLSEHRSVILCGPPGSGKTMTLLSSLRRIPDAEVVSMNFSSETSCEVLIRTLELHGTYRKSSMGEVFSPKKPGSWIVLFCDEINLPKPDHYGTQRAISFLRQLVEYGGFWRSDRVWVNVENVQIVGACNPPTDPGRVPLSSRFLRHCPVVFVDYPEEESLMTIYGTFVKAILKAQPALRGLSDAITQTMVQFYLCCQGTFIPAKQPHYIFSPRELTRWTRGVHETLSGLEYVAMEDLVRIIVHEGIRLFQDRLVDTDDRVLAENELRSVISLSFPGVNLDVCLRMPILFSNYLSKAYQSTDRDSLHTFLKARLSSFYEEEMDIPLVLFDDALDHILRIDRVFRQPQGHMLLIGISGSGKSTLTRFVCWMNGMTVVQPAMHNRYTIADFEEDLRGILRKAGCKGESLCLLLDESNVADTAFLERINTLLANAEIPGLFEGDEYSALMSLCKDAALRDGHKLDTHEELYQWFTTQVSRNLHVMFTMNPPRGDMTKKTTTSPALFNRCVLNWMGDWNDQALYQVAVEFTDLVDLDKPSSSPPNYLPVYDGLKSPISFRNLIMDLLIFVHRSASKLNEQVSKSLLQSCFVTPRHYVDLVNRFTMVYTEKRFELEERQRHLIVGLERLIETFEQVDELKQSLNVKQVELESKSTLANEKLKKMVKEQQEAESKRSFSVQLQQALAQKRTQIEERKKIAMDELAQAEPAVLEAQQSVSSIKKQHLTEVRSMGNPPAAVKLTMESVCILLGHKVDSWKSVQAVLRRDDFIGSIVNYDTAKLTTEIQEVIRENYMSDPNYAFDNVNRASKACGPLVSWVIAQIEYATILERVGPLREEVKQLEESATDAEHQAAETESIIDTLEKSIAKYKDEYAVLIAEVQSLKKEMDLVKDRVDRSTKVLSNLSSEQQRWSDAKDSFAVQMETLVGDCLLSSAFLTYCGIFDQSNRTALLNNWKAKMREAKVVFQEKLSIPIYLSSAEERSVWTQNGLPSDDLCLENAVMLNRTDRFPLIVDPSEQALEFLKIHYKSKNISITSFRDGAFLKTLESALRFGNPIIIQDAEDFDPIINPILNKEIRKSGGRNLCRLGKKDVDFASSFKMFLFTKNSINFSPDICSRVSIINFTITPASLLLQCLDRLLRSQRPDIELKRKELLKMQGEYQLRLHCLEKELLDALNESNGNILDNEKVMNTLEVLKMEATEIVAKVAETDEVLNEVDSVTMLYKPLAEKSASIFFCIQQLPRIEYFYEFSLEYFFDLFDIVLGLANLNNNVDLLEAEMFKVYFKEISMSLRQSDVTLYALLLAQIKLKDSLSLNEEYEWAYFLNGTDECIERTDESVMRIFNEKVASRVTQLCRLGSFKDFGKHVLLFENEWKEIYGAKEPEILLSDHCQNKLKSNQI